MQDSSRPCWQYSQNGTDEQNWTKPLEEVAHDIPEMMGLWRGWHVFAVLFDAALGLLSRQSILQ